MKNLVASVDGHYSLVVNTDALTDWWLKATGVVPKNRPNDEINGAVAIAPGVIFGTYDADNIPCGTLVHKIVHHKQQVELGLVGFAFSILLLAALVFVPQVQASVFEASSAWPAIGYFLVAPVLPLFLSMPIKYAAIWIINIIQFQGDARRSYQENIFEEEAYNSHTVINYLNRRPFFA